jgi:putative hemolysin
VDEFMGPWLSYLPELLGVAILLLLSAFFSGAETALFSLSRSQVHRFSEGSFSERVASRLLRQPQRLLSTVLVGNTAVNVLLTSLCTSTVYSLVRGRETLATILSVLVVWPLLLTFGELTPKTAAASHSQTIARWVALPLEFLAWLTAPAAALLRLTAQWVMWLFGQSAPAEWDNVTRQEITAMMTVAEETGTADPQEREMVRRILRMDIVQACDLMVPRTEVIAIRDSATLAEAYAKARQTRRSRLPVFHDDLDDIWGVVSTMDLPRWRATPWMQRPLSDCQAKVTAARRADVLWEPLPVYPVLLVPETASVERLLTALQENRSHLAVLVAEHGGTAGILTMNDIIEELMGQIAPREGGVRQEVVRVGDGWHVDGRLHLRDLADAIGIELSSEEFDTVGGFLMERLERLPRTGDELTHGGVVFRVLRMAGRRVGTVRLTPLSPPAEEPPREGG